jgi:hypothetical protein
VPLFPLVNELRKKKTNHNISHINIFEIQSRLQRNMARGKATDDSTLTSSSPKRRKFKLFSRSGKKPKPSSTSNTLVADLSPPVEISVSEDDKLSDGKAKPRQLFPNQFKHDPSLKCKLQDDNISLKSCWCLFIILLTMLVLLFVLSKIQ